MPRPSLERTYKYIPVIPRAHSKLGREASRGSRDLRKLVGHANFLDTLMEQLDLDYIAETCETEECCAEEGEVHDDSASASSNQVDFFDDGDWETEYPSSTDVSDDEEPVTPECDDENDEDHALGRTPSHTRRSTGAAVMHTIPITSSHGAEYSTSVSVATRELDEDEMEDSSQEADKGGLLSVVELSGEVEELFGDKCIHSERAQVAAALSSFDVGSTVQAVGGGI